MIDSRKKPKYVVLWSVDYNYKEYDRSIKFPFYEICKDGKTFLVLYHGASSIKRTNTLKEAQEYVRGRIRKEYTNVYKIPERV